MGGQTVYSKPSFFYIFQKKKHEIYFTPPSIFQQLMEGQIEKEKDKQTIAMSKNINDGRGNREINL